MTLIVTRNCPHDRTIDLVFGDLNATQVDVEITCLDCGKVVHYEIRNK